MKYTNFLQKRQCNDILLTLSVLFVLPLYYYGLRVLFMLFFAVVTSLVSELIYQGAVHKRIYYDITSLITAMICTLLSSAASSYYIVVIAVAFALFVVKYPFGGTGKNIFNPAAAGLCFVGFCFPEQVFAYPEALSPLQLWGGAFTPEVSPDFQIRLGSVPNTEPIKYIFGQFAGPLGSTAAILLLACLVFLVVRKTISIYAPIAAIVTISIFLLFFPRVPAARFEVLIPELIAGVFFFSVIFLATDPVTLPKTKLGQLVFGIMLGFFGWVFKCYGVDDYNILYALLLCNAFSGSCDSLNAILIKQLKKRVN